MALLNLGVNSQGDAQGPLRADPVPRLPEQTLSSADRAQPAGESGPCRSEHRDPWTQKVRNGVRRAWRRRGVSNRASASGSRVGGGSQEEEPAAHPLQGRLCREAQIEAWPAHAGSGQVWGPGSVGQRPLQAAGGQPLPSPAPWPSSSPPPSRSPSAGFSWPTSGCIFTRKHVLLQRSGVSPHPPGFCRISSPGHGIACLKKLGLVFFFFSFSQ